MRDIKRILFYYFIIKNKGGSFYVEGIKETQNECCCSWDFIRCYWGINYSYNSGSVKILSTLSQKYPRIFKYSMITFVGILLAISLFYLVIKRQIIFLAIVACLAMGLCDVIYKRK